MTILITKQNQILSHLIIKFLVKSRLALINFAVQTEQKNEYSKNFSEISNKYRESKLDL